MSGLKGNGIVVAVVSVVATVLLSPLVEPPLKRLGTNVMDAVFPPASPVRILSCAPLKDSRTVLSVSTPNGSRVIADGPHHLRNETFIYLENTSSLPIKNATLTAYPLAFGKESPNLSLAYIGFTSIRGSVDYKPTYRETDNSFELGMPQLNPHEAILLSQTYAVPVGFIVEVYADGLSEKRVFQPGCPERITVRDLLERKTNLHVGPNCKVEPDLAEPHGLLRSKCNFEDNIPFTMSEEMRGQMLGSENVIVQDRLQVVVPVLREGVMR